MYKPIRKIMRSIAIYTSLEGNKVYTNLEHAENLKAKFKGTVEEVPFLNVDPFNEDNIEVTNDEVTISYTINDGEEFDFYVSEPVTYQVDEECLVADWNYFDDFAFTEKDLQTIYDRVQSKVDTFDEDTFRPCYESR